MPIINLITSQRQAPANAGNAYVQDRSGQIIGGAISQLGSVLKVAEEKYSAKVASIEGFKAENALMEMSRQKYVDALENKRGELALPNEESGTKGVFGDYQEEADKYVSDIVAKIDPRYQQPILERLTGVADRYKDRFMAYQAQQLGEHRKAVLYNNVKQVEDELAMTMETGGDLSTVDVAFGKIEGLVNSEAKGAPTKEVLDAKKGELYRKAIQAATINYPENALQMLDDKKVVKVLNPDTREALQKSAEQAKVKKTVDQTLAVIQANDLSYPSQVKLAQDTLQGDKEALNKVLTQLSYNKNKQDELKKIQQDELFQSTYESIVDNDNPPTPQDIYSDPKYEALEVSQREWLVNKLTGGKGGDKPEKANDFFLWTNAQEQIYSGRMDEQGVRDGVRRYIESGGKQGIPPQYGKELYGDVQSYREAPQIGAAGSVLSGENGFDKEDQAKFNDVFYREIRSAAARNNGKMPSYDEILQIGRKIAKPINEDKWFQKPRYKDPTFSSLWSEEDAVLAPVIRQQQGWDSAEFDENSGFWYGKKGGKVFRYDPVNKKTYEFIPK